MPILYRIDVLQALKDSGYSTYKLRKDKLLSESTIQKLRNNEIIAIESLATICELLDCDIADIIYFER